MYVYQQKYFHFTVPESVAQSYCFMFFSVVQYNIMRIENDMFAIALKCLINSYFGKYRKYLSFSFWILAEYVELWKILDWNVK